MYWSFQKDKVGSFPKGWYVSGTNGLDFSATVQQQGTNHFLRVKRIAPPPGPAWEAGVRSHAAVGTTWGKGTPADDWMVNAKVSFDIRLHRVHSAAFWVQLTGNYPPHGAETSNIELFTQYMTNESGPTLQDLRECGNTPTGVWHKVEIFLTGNPGPLKANDGVPRGTYEMHIDGEKRRWGNYFGGWISQPNHIDLPHGLRLNGIRWAEWAGDGMNFDIDNVRIRREPDKAPAPEKAAEPPAKAL